MTPPAKWKTVLRKAWLPVVVITGIVARFAAGFCAHTYDFDSYRMVIDIVEHGGNVYAQTVRYNYGPVWFHILHLLDLLARHNAPVFRWLLISLLTATYAGIFWVLWRKFGRLPATLFFLNPVSIMITGHYNQFDNAAILPGLWAMLLVGDDFEKPVDRRRFAGLALLGLSLMTKHVLFAFPLWLAVKQKGLREKCVVLLVPPAIFLLGFAPYWAAGQAGIVSNVFLYKSEYTSYLYDLIVPAFLQGVLNAQGFWFLWLGLFAFILRGRPALESLLLYTAVLVAASPATAIQYLAIPSAFTSVFVNYFTVTYTVIATGHCAHFIPWSIIRSPLLSDRSLGNPCVAICFLALGVVWIIWGESVLTFLRKRCRKASVSIGRRS